MLTVDGMETCVTATPHGDVRHTVSAIDSDGETRFFRVKDGVWVEYWPPKETA